MSRWNNLKVKSTNSTNSIIEKAKKITIPFFDNVPLYDVSVFFWKGIINGSITTRASAIAFNFILALFPATIFFFTLIPYIPIEDFQQDLFMIINNIMPSDTSLIITIEDVIMRPHGGLLSFGFFATLIFATNGASSIISAFNATTHAIETRSWLNQRLVALVLVLIIFGLTTLSVTLIAVSETVMYFLVKENILQINLTYYLLSIGKWIVICALLFFANAFLFYLAPAKKSKFRFISAGGSLATSLTIITSIGFSFYINNFGNYNKLYGSIGTLLVVMMWLYLNSLAQLLGFELNASITSARSNSHTFSAKKHSPPLIAVKQENKNNNYGISM